MYLEDEMRLNNDISTARETREVSNPLKYGLDIMRTFNTNNAHKLCRLNKRIDEYGSTAKHYKLMEFERLGFLKPEIAGDLGHRHNKISITQKGKKALRWASLEPEPKLLDNRRSNILKTYGVIVSIIFSTVSIITSIFTLVFVVSKN
jgi:hypothetical protein